MWSKVFTTKTWNQGRWVHVIKSTYDIDLSHGVDENNSEDGDGQPKQEGPAQVPHDAA